MISIEESGAPGGIRTPDLLVRSQTLYPAELRARRNADSVPLDYDTAVSTSTALSGNFMRGDSARAQRVIRRPYLSSQICHSAPNLAGDFVRVLVWREAHGRADGHANMPRASGTPFGLPQVKQASEANRHYRQA
jgi:hypothetical protein